MQNTMKLAAFNAEKDQVENMLRDAFSRFNKLRYDVLDEFGYCVKMHDLQQSLQSLISRFNDNQLEESDFPEEFADEPLDEPADDRSEKLDEDEQYL